MSRTAFPLVLCTAVLAMTQLLFAADAPLDAIPEEQSVEISAIDREIIVERYTNGQKKIEREVAMDHEENFVNHGPMRIYNSKGVFVGGGDFEWGRRVGKWTRIYNTVQEAPILKQVATRGFKAPFISESTFANDKLDGVWIVMDAAGKPVIQWEFAKGKRSGQWSWFNATGDVSQQVNYANGVINGDIISFRGKEDVKVLQRYINGRKLVPDVEKYSNRRVKKQGHVLLPKDVTDVTVDWWAGVVEEALVRTEGNTERHGEYKYWYSNGKPEMSGSYDQGKETGGFVWYYENGVKQTEGYFVDGRREGNWNEWHANGTAKGTGMYAKGQRSGAWRSWHENGMRKRDASFQGGQQIGSIRVWDRNGARVYEEAQRQEEIAERQQDDERSL